VTAWRLFALALAVAVSACGGEDGSDILSRDDYQAEILSIVEDSAEPTSTYTDLVVERLPADQCESLMATFEEQVDDLVERVAALQPPERIEAIHDDFVAAARDSVDRVGEIRTDVGAGEVECGQELNDMLNGMPSSDRADRLIARLEQNGYVVFGD
jgi:hypothetical protein